jgi:phenylacetate-CoA ligase
MSDFNSEYQESIEELDKSARKKALTTFEQAAERVPAYGHFLKFNGVNPKSIKNYEDFKRLPLITKENYLRKYSLDELMWDGDRFKGDIISVSSGSSGEPFFWLRDKSQHAEAAEIYFDIYKNIFGCDETPTLLVVCFSMGIWIAGSYTTQGALSTIIKGLKINVVTPALDIADCVAVIKRLKNDYEQIILAGYPPFLKDLVDQGADAGINWLDLNVGYTAAGEAIGEELRDYFIKNGTKNNDPTKVVSIYGTVDTGIVAHETPLSSLIRRQIYQNQRQKDLFGKEVLPTLAQYDPMKKFIETDGGNIVFTSATALPLIRYNIKDAGGTYSDMSQLITHEPELLANLKKYDIDPSLWHKPFVYVHGRADFTASLYAVLIYPENIKKALLRDKLAKYATSRFVMSIKRRRNLNQFLEIAVELRPGIKPTEGIKQTIYKFIVETLSTENFEYRKLLNSIGEKAHPKIVLINSGDPKYFSRTSNKQRWTAEALKNR